jgi:hypothetical protein
MLLQLAKLLQPQQACMAVLLLAAGATATPAALVYCTSSSSSSSSKQGLASCQLVAASGAHNQAARQRGCLA